MSFKLKVKVKANGARGTLNAKSIFQIVVDSWSDLSQATNSLSEEEQQAVRDHFNSLIDENDDLGDILFGNDPDEFEQRVLQLDGTFQEKYAKELVNAEIIDIEYM